MGNQAARAAGRRQVGGLTYPAPAPGNDSLLAKVSVLPPN